MSIENEDFLSVCCGAEIQINPQSSSEICQKCGQECEIKPKTLGVNVVDEIKAKGVII